jgi:hypothetical protein
LLHRPGDAAALRDNIRRLLKDDGLRVRLARQGVEDMARLRSAAAVERLQRILKGEEAT